MTLSHFQPQLQPSASMCFLQPQRWKHDLFIQLLEEAKMHKEMCRRMGRVVDAVAQIFPAVEVVRPGCRAGIQSLSAVNLSLEKAKSLLQYCSISSKLYLAITGDSLMHKFERVRLDLDENLRQLAAIVSHNLSKRIIPVLEEINQAKLFLDSGDQELCAEIVSLLLKEKSESSDEKGIFSHVATKLGLIIPRAVHEEQKALQNLLEKARRQGEKRKESIISYFLHLLKDYRKGIKSSSSNSLLVSRKILPSTNSFDGKTLKLEVNKADTHPSSSDCSSSEFNILDRFKNRIVESSQIPDEFRCPISLQLMSDPVIISSGHTFERLYIEAWFQEGHVTCPKTKRRLEDTSLTPNSCVKNLIALWCQENGVPIPSSPSPSDFSLITWNSDSFSSLKGWSKAETIIEDRNVMSTTMNSISSMDDEKTSFPWQPGVTRSQLQLQEHCHLF